MGGSGVFPHDIDAAVADVACRQLGNELGFAVTSAAKVGRADTDPGEGMAYKVLCEGSEGAVDSCPVFEHVTWASSSHSYDVGVACTFLEIGECEECVAGKFSGTTGVAGCMECVAGSYSSAAGARGCQLVSASKEHRLGSCG